MKEKIEKPQRPPEHDNFSDELAECFIACLPFIPLLLWLAIFSAVLAEIGGD